ncbi:hypothetical protein [Saccharothrix sp. Mg75]|uniref:hypothetical protein n=1 Tax=Saccharothrix sp. Mg75 TaxID=3445357 RepID=UPI003EF0607A
MPTMRNEPQHDDGQPMNRATRRGARSSGAAQPRYGGGRLVVSPRQYAMRRR